MARREIGLGVIGCGLMGRELASAAARWFHLVGLDFAPRVVAACDLNPAASDWFAKNVPGVRLVTDDYRRLLDAADVHAVYCAVPHNLHERLYVDIIRAGKHLLAEKPFGIGLPACETILAAARANPRVLVRCSSEYPFFPGSQFICRHAREGRFGRIIEVEAGFWHSSDLDPRKPINWKRIAAVNGQYGCLGDLGLHVVHLPLRFGWHPRNVRAFLSKIVSERPDKSGAMVPCDTWDNALLACETAGPQGTTFPMLLSTKRIAPGEGNTWFIRVIGTSLSAEFTTKNPKLIRFLDYTPGAEQAWKSLDLPHKPPYETITGAIFEFGFSDSLLQMLAAFVDEALNGRDGMRQPFYCATPEEALESHKLFTAALESHARSAVVALT